VHNDANSDNFLGYDIYYRVYQKESDATSDRSTVVALADSTSSAPDTVLTKIKNLGYKKIYNALTPTVEPTPLLNFELSNSATKYYLYMESGSVSTNWYYTTNADTSSEGTELVRGIEQASGSNSFNYPYTTSDGDYKGSSGSSSGSTVYFMAFAIAYGYNLASLTNIYSLPASLEEPLSFTLP
jgi:hypothetical protein